MPDLRQLRAFLAVADELSFTRAAELLHLQQQTVSKTIRQLERELGVELLERTTREVRLTAAGAELRESGTSVLAGAEAAFARTRRIGTGSLGRVRVGVTPAIGRGDREEVTAILRESQEDVSVALFDVRPAELRQRLRARDLDLGLIRSTGADDPKLHRAPLRPTPAVICLARDHPLAGADAVTLERFDGERLLLPSPAGTPYSDMVLALFSARGATVTPIEAHITGGPSILTELLPTQTIALMPAGTPLPPGVVAVPARDVGLPIVLLWPAGLPSPAVRRLREALAAPPAAAA